MSTLTAEFQPAATELPLVALVRVMLAPVVCTLCLALSLAIHREDFSVHYGMLAVVAFLVSMQVFGELPLTNGRSRMSFLLPGRTIMVKWVTVIGILLFIAFAAKVTGLFSRRVVLAWLAITPFALQTAQEVVRLLLHRLVSSSAAGRVKVVVGVNDTACELTRRIGEDPCHGTFMGFFDDRGGGRIGGVGQEQVLGGLADVVDSVKRNRINVVYITLPLTRDPRIQRLLDGL
ncbi:MAG TPA: hypothetical protein VFO57_05510, partial [Burkholderiales bacterium]|nr:hypothetical protein [Burkholderiales bacterium]